MQQTINFEPSAQVQQPLDVLATTRRTIHQHLLTTQHLNRWLDTKSEFYSRICDFSVTRLLVIRIHLVFLCIIGTVLTVEHHPLLSVVFALCAAYWGHRVNRLDKEGGAL